MHGLLSPEQLATEYTKSTGEPVSRVAIIKHFNKAGVPWDLAAKIRAKADALVAASLVTGVVSTETKARDTKIIEAGPVQSATVLLPIRLCPCHQKSVLTPSSVKTR